MRKKQGNQVLEIELSQLDRTECKGFLRLDLYNLHVRLWDEPTRDTRLSGR